MFHLSKLFQSVEFVYEFKFNSGRCPLLNDIGSQPLISLSFNPILDGGGANSPPPPQLFFLNIAQKPLGVGN